MTQTETALFELIKLNHDVSVAQHNIIFDLRDTQDANIQESIEKLNEAHDKIEYLKK